MNVKDLGNRVVLMTGIGVLARFLDTEPEDWDRQIAVNIYLRGLAGGIGRQLALPCAASIGCGRGAR